MICLYNSRKRMGMGTENRKKIIINHFKKSNLQTTNHSFSFFSWNAFEELASNSYAFKTSSSKYLNI